MFAVVIGTRSLTCFCQVTPSSIVVLHSLQSAALPQQPGVCWSAPRDHTIVFASFAWPVIAIILSHLGSNTVMILNFSDHDSVPKVTASFQCEQSAALHCVPSKATSSCIVAVATYVQNELLVWRVGLEGGVVEKLLSTKLPDLLSHDSSPRDAAIDTDSIINCIWIQLHNSHDPLSTGIDIYLGSRSGMLHKLLCSTSTRAMRVLDSWKLSDSPLEFVFIGGDQHRRDELLVVGEGQWLIGLNQQQSQHLVHPVLAAHQSFEGACNSCSFRSPSTPRGVILSLRVLPKLFPSPSSSNIGGAVIMNLPSVESGSSHVCKATTLSEINIDAACSHVAVLPRLSLTIVGALVHNRASLLFISQGRIIHSRPLIAAGGGAFMSLDAREDESEAGRFTIAVTLAGGQHDASFEVGRGDFTMFEGSVGSSWDARGLGDQQTLQGGMTAAGGGGGAICILRARMKTKIEEEERFVGGNIRPTSVKFKVQIAFDEPFYQRCSRDEHVQGSGVLTLAAGGGASIVGRAQVVVACVSGAIRVFSSENARVEVSRFDYHFLRIFSLYTRLGSQVSAAIKRIFLKLPGFHACNT